LTSLVEVFAYIGLITNLALSYYYRLHILIKKFQWLVLESNIYWTVLHAFSPHQHVQYLYGNHLVFRTNLHMTQHTYKIYKLIIIVYYYLFIYYLYLRVCYGTCKCSRATCHSVGFLLSVAHIHNIYWQPFGPWHHTFSVFPRSRQ
jgi:hypothetical protein